MVQTGWSPDRFLPGMAMLVLGLLGGVGRPVLAAPAPVAQVPEGIWRGAFKDRSGTVRGALAFVASGRGGLAEARLLLEDGTQVMVTLTPRGRGRGLMYPRLANPRALTCSLARVRPRAAFSGSYLAAGGEAGSFAFNDYLSLYDTPTALVDMAGTYRSVVGQNSLNRPLSLTLRPDGRFDIPDGDEAVLAGDLAVPDPAKCIIKVRYRLLADGHPVREGSGLGYFFLNPATGGRTLLLAGSHGERCFLGLFEGSVP